MASNQFKFYLNDDEREKYRDLIYAAEPMTAESEFYHAVRHANDPRPQDKDKKKKVTRKKKKGKQQKKIRTFFKQKENEDGYPLKHCTYEPSEKRQVYRPPGYGDNMDQKLPHCCDCHLKPCVATVFYDESEAFLTDLHHDKGQTIPAAQIATTVFLHKKYCKVIKRRYLKKLQPPKCVTEVVEELIDDLDEDTSDDDVDDSGLEDEFILDQDPRSVPVRETLEDEQKQVPDEVTSDSDDSLDGTMTLADLKKGAAKPNKRRIKIMPKENKKVAPSRKSFGDSIYECLVDVDYLLNCNSDEDETREEYFERKRKSQAREANMAKLRNQTLSDTGSSDEENELV